MRNTKKQIREYDITTTTLIWCQPLNIMIWSRSKAQFENFISKSLKNGMHSIQFSAKCHVWLGWFSFGFQWAVQTCLKNFCHYYYFIARCKHYLAWLVTNLTVISLMVLFFEWHMDGRRKCHSIFLSAQILCFISVYCKNSLKAFDICRAFGSTIRCRKKKYHFLLFLVKNWVYTYLSDAIGFFKFTSISSSTSAKIWKDRHLHIYARILNPLH